ncbi:MAG TPA: DNA-binding domain-containing protein [Tepidisphaeraceae bacterium]|nr:DNA-binding domain-containing protein [Tepidisphaeraceae bacterium]
MKTRSAQRSSPSASPPVSGRRQTEAELRDLQRLAFACISQPLGPGNATLTHFRDGRTMQEVAAGFIKPNDRLTSLDRIAIYNRQYWFRLMDCLWDDYPGLRALLGLRRFEKLRIAYLIEHPSKSFTMRNLGNHLVDFLEKHPELTAPLETMCLDMARFEWAQVVGFDGQEKKPLTVDDLLGQDPAMLRLSLQPYLTLLEMDYPLDDFVIAVKKRDASMRSEASNAVETDRVEKKPRRSRPPKAGKTFVAVHRHQNDLYYKRLEKPQYQILKALGEGETLTDACAAAIVGDGETDSSENPPWLFNLQTWFRSWAELGWFCRRDKA